MSPLRVAGARAVKTELICKPATPSASLINGISSGGLQHRILAKRTPSLTAAVVGNLTALTETIIANTAVKYLLDHTAGAI